MGGKPLLHTQAPKTETEAEPTQRLGMELIGIQLFSTYHSLNYNGNGSAPVEVPMFCEMAPNPFHISESEEYHGQVRPRTMKWHLHTHVHVGCPTCPETADGTGRSIEPRSSSPWRERGRQTRSAGNCIRGDQPVRGGCALLDCRKYCYRTPLIDTPALQRGAGEGGGLNEPVASANTTQHSAGCLKEQGRSLAFRVTSGKAGTMTGSLRWMYVRGTYVQT